jgi:hypothetical protein
MGWSGRAPTWQPYPHAENELSVKCAFLRKSLWDRGENACGPNLRVVEPNNIFRKVALLQI